MRRRLFLLIDAMGWEVVRRHHAFETLAPHRKALRTILGYSSGAIPTILSGRLPAEHGHWALFPRALGKSPFEWTRWLRILPRSWQHRYRVRRFIREHTLRREGITGYFQIYEVPLAVLPRLDYTERLDLWSAGGLRPLESVFDHWENVGHPYFCSGWIGPDSDKFARASEATRDPAVRTFFLYGTELDALMHRVGTHDPEVGALIRRYEDWTASLLRSLAEPGAEAPELWVFSDHGMTDTRGTHDLMSRVAALGLKEGRDYMAFYDSTMARFWVESAGAREALSRLLADLPFGQLMQPAELEREGLAFSNRRYGDLIFLMHPGQLIAPSYMGEGAPRAMHGFHPADRDSPGAVLCAHDIPESILHIRDMFGVLTA